MNNKIHELKTWPESFEKIVSGVKTFEARKNDRDFQENDILMLKEFSYMMNDYTGKICFVRVTHILKGPDMETIGMMDNGFCIMSIKIIHQTEWKKAKLEES